MSQSVCEGSGLPPASITKTGPQWPGGAMVAKRGTCQNCGGEFSLLRSGPRRRPVVRKHNGNSVSQRGEPRTVAEENFKAEYGHYPIRVELLAPPPDPQLDARVARLFRQRL